MHGLFNLRRRPFLAHWLLHPEIFSMMQSMLTLSRCLRRSGALREGAADAQNALHTFAHLQAGAKEGVRKLKDASSSLKAELHDLQSQIPLLVRSIWGKHSEGIVAALRQRQQSAARLIRQWEDAEHRLIAVANSLTTLKTGQKLVAVGAPLAAAHLMHGDTTAYCYHSPMASQGPRAELRLGQLEELVSRIAKALADELALLQRGLYLFFLFLPALLTAPICLLTDRHRDRWLGLMRWTLEQAGPAFIKWGQWAATRPDLFSKDVCAELAKMQTKAPSHSFAHTRATVEAAFGAPIEHLFSEFSTAPVASGSIAQVHRAVLSSEGAKRAQRALKGGMLPLPARQRKEAAVFAEGAPVAVKVRHPGVSEMMERDFGLMQRIATLLGMMPGGAGPQLKESLMQFGAPMREQLDLRCEADALHRFAENFKWWSGVRFPLPAARPMVASDVLVESFEEGDHISSYVGTECRHNKKLADLGLNCYLKMLIKDNFIHADLHPGNILVRLDSLTPGSLASRVCSTLGWDFQLPRLVLLDVGMTARLTSDDQHNMLSFFKSLTTMDGSAVADAVMTFSETAVPDPVAFRQEMASMFAALDPEHLRMNTQEVIGDMMDTIRRHGVHIRGVVSTVVITTMVLEGWSTKLNPDIRVLDTLRETLPSAWYERVGSAVDRVVSDSALALA